ncbi:hypothetical protein E2C01_040395 [Portunus trituberculatus]|uniref:Uncharacterized protein n=1 Tax=Portunus trituberculatus TaxID=210409 RepID=A0A5B7FGD6_PORTR|nr:hypothetical protein [Portunus trituberculatus]
MQFRFIRHYERCTHGFMFPEAPRAAISRARREDALQHLASSTHSLISPTSALASGNNVFVQRHRTSALHYADEGGRRHALV